jgi:glycosyltransferase involved in cell wall biosynthesis
MLRKRIMMQGSKTTLVTMRPEDFPSRYSAVRQAILSAQSILATSEFVRSMYISNGYPADRIKVLPLGIEKPAISLDPKPARISDDGVTFAFVGSLIPAKGLDLLLQAFRRLQSPNARLLIYGEESSSPPEYHRKISMLARGDDRIHFMGAFAQSQRTEVYQKMDVLVLPSRVPESFSLVAREALALDRPVIAAEIGALPELIQPGVNGDLFPAEDEQALFLRLERIVSQPDWLDTLKNAGRKTIYSMEEHTHIIESIYLEAMSDRAITRRN